MSDFDFMKNFADLIAEAMNDLEIWDGRDRYDLTIRYQAEARIASVGEDVATVKVTLNATRDGYRARQFTIAVSEEKE